MEGQYRYPGTQAFQPTDAAIFYGRDADTRQLLRLLRLEQLVILHGKSGLGKTSLINAGILPWLQQRFAPVEDNDEATAMWIEEVRFGAYHSDAGRQPVQVLQDQLHAKEPHPLLATFLPEMDNLWVRCKSHQLAQATPGTLLLVFDQFEELFTYSAQAVQDFKAQLAQLLHTGVPTELRQAVHRAGKKLDSDERKNLLRPLAVKVLLTIRSDRLSLLDQFTTHLPNMLVNLYELHPLDREQARAAIVQPAAQQSDWFATPAFAFSDAALSEMLDGLSNDRGEIESFQLQLLCRYLEQRMAAHPDQRLVSEADFGGQTGIQDILHSYYERQLAALPTTDRLTARRFIEEGLIVGENRVPVAAGVEASRFGVGQPLLDQLLATRLIRAENIHLGKIYELSHDTLIEPVLRSYRQRQAEEERERIEQELAAERARAATERQARRRNRWLAFLGFSLFAVAAIAGIFALSKYQEAETARVAVEQNARAAAAAGLAARAWEIYDYDQTLAARIAQAALRLDEDNADVRQTLGRMVNASNASFYARVLDAHEFEIIDAAFSPDGRYLATASHDEKIVLYDSTGTVLHTFRGGLSGDHQPGHRGPANGVAFTPDGSKLFSVGSDGMVKVWDTRNGTKITEWQAHDHEIYAITYIPTTEQIVTGGADQRILFWSMEGELVRELSGHRGTVVDLSVSPRERYLLSSSADGTARLWTLQGQPLRTLSSGNVAVTASAFAADGNHIGLALSNRTAEIWTIAGQKLYTLNGHNGQVTDIEFLPDEPTLVTASEDGTAKLWTLEGIELLTLYGHRKRVNLAKVAPDGQHILTGGFDFTARLWNVGLNLDVQRHRHQSFIFSVDVHATDQRIVTASKDLTAKVWTLEGQWLADLSGHTDVVMTAFFVESTDEIVTASADGTVRLWTSGGTLVQTFTHTAPLNFARATQTGDRIVSGDSQGQVYVWNRTGELIQSWQADPVGKSVNSVAIHPGQEQLLTAQGQSVKVWDWTGTLLDSFVIETADFVNKAFYDATGDLIYTPARQLPIQAWQSDGQLVQTLYGHTSESYWVAIHPTQDLIATASWDQTVKLWTKAGDLIRTIPHPGGVYSVAFTADADYLVTGGHDDIGRIWQIDGTLVAALGQRVDPLSVLTLPSVAQLTDIPFSITEENIPEQYIAILAGNNPDQYLREAHRSAQRGTANVYTLEEKLSYFDQAIVYYQKAQELLEADTTQYIEEKIAAVYKDRGEQLFMQQRYAEALASFEAGLAYAESDYLVVLKTIGLLFTDQLAEAQALARANKSRPTPGIDWYETYPEAVTEDLAYFDIQFGLRHPDTEKLLSVFE